jgi:hypothetical protein
MTDNKIVDFIAIPSSTTTETKNFLITTIRNACEIYGDDQTGISRHIYDTLRGKLGGDWFVVVCPKDNKTYNASFSAANNQFEEPVRYYLTRENKMYLMVKYP